VNDHHPDLTELLRGELTNAEALATAEHVRGCDSCRAALVDDALGHGLLTRARRTLGDRPAGVPVQPTQPLELPEELRRELGRRPRRTRALLAGVAAVTLVAAGAGAALGARNLATRTDGSDPQAIPQRTATLEPVEGSATGKVSMGTSHAITRMQMTTSALPEAPRGEFYYAWLFDPRTNKMLPLGQVTAGRVATFEIPESLVESYTAIDVSLEADDGDPGHSVTSVLRATYADPAKSSS
jgi:anti-sigma-K factor RskA